MFPIKIIATLWETMREKMHFLRRGDIPFMTQSISKAKSKDKPYRRINAVIICLVQGMNMDNELIL